MSDKVIITKSKIDGLAQTINNKAGTSGSKTIDEMVNIVNNISIGGDLPTGTIELAEDGTYDVAQYASAIVSAGENVQYRRFTGSITSTVTGSRTSALLVDDPIIGQVAALDSLLIKLTTDFSGDDAYTLLGCIGANSFFVIAEKTYQYAHRIGATAGVFAEMVGGQKFLTTTSLGVGQLIIRGNQLRWNVNSVNYAARPCNYTVEMMW